MSKKPTPLEALWKLYTYDDLKSRNPIAYLLEQENLSKYYKTIETALKRLEIIDKLNKKHCEDTQKKLKALEIIKSKITNISFKYGGIMGNVIKLQFGCDTCYLHFDENDKNFDLLKEVLK